MNSQATQSRSSKVQQIPLSRSEFAARTFIATGIAAMMTAVVFVLWWSRSVFFLLFAGVVFGVFLHGLSDWISQRTRLSYYWSLALVVTLLLAILGVMGWLLGAQISRQFSQLAETLPASFQQLRNELEQYPWGEWLVQKATKDGGDLSDGRNVLSRVTGLVGGVLSGISAVVVIGFVGLYGAIDPNYYRKGVLHLVPKNRRERGTQVLDLLDLSLRNWLISRIVSMLIIGLVTSLGLWFLGVPMFLALGLLAFFLEAIPTLGPVLAAIPALVVAWSDGGSPLAGQTVVLFLVIQTIESYILLPVLQQETVYLPPILSVMAVVFFGAIGGILGAFVAAPLLVVLMLLVKMLYVEDILGDYKVKGLDAEE